jgi:CheY-like chemotaxis protein
MAPPPRKLRILLIEDNDVRFDRLVHLFQRERVQLVRAATGGAALRMVRTDAFDLILLDHDLEERRPGGLHGASATGFDVARALTVGGPNRRTVVRIHSMNTDRRQEMMDFLRVNGHDVELIPMDEWTREMASALVDDLLDELDD